MFSTSLFLLALAAIPNLANARLFPKTVEANHPFFERHLTHYEEFGSFEENVVEPAMMSPDEIIAIDRGLAAGCDNETLGLCLLGLIFGGEQSLYEGGCGGLFEDVEGAWCYDADFGSEVCCGTEDTCCDPKTGAIVGITVGLIVVLIAAICGCCYCCKCCCCVSLSVMEKRYAFCRRILTASCSYTAV